MAGTSPALASESVDAAIKDKAGCVGAALRQIIIKTPSGRVGLAVTDPEAPAFEGWGVAVGFATLSWKAASYRGACLKDTRPETQQGAGPFTVQPLGSVIHLFSGLRYSFTFYRSD